MRCGWRPSRTCSRFARFPVWRPVQGSARVGAFQVVLEESRAQTMDRSKVLPGRTKSRLHGRIAMLRDLSKLIEEEDSSGGDGERLEKDLRQAAQQLWRAQFIYENDWGTKTSYDLLRQHTAYFENLFDALGLPHRRAAGRPLHRPAGGRTSSRQAMRLDESLLLLVLRLYYEEAFKRFEISEFGEIEVESETILQVYEERTRRPRPTIGRVHEILREFKQRGLVRIVDQGDNRNFTLFLAPCPADGRRGRHPGFPGGIRRQIGQQRGQGADNRRNDTMIELRRIVMIDWYLFRAEQIDMRGMTALIGPNGAGKSAVIDAVQTVLTGANMSSIRFNPSAQSNTKSKRSIREYCLGVVSLDEKGERSEPTRSHAYTYVVLGFEDVENGSTTSIGIAFSASAATGDESCEARFLVARTD